RDVVVPFLELASPESGGVLPAVEYVFAQEAVKGRKYQIYEYDLKQSLSQHVSVRVPAELDAEVAARIEATSRTVFTKLNIRDLGRIDFRVNDKGEVFFIEVNALPSLEPGAGIYASAAMRGLPTVESVLATVVESASRRYGISTSTPNRKSPPLRVGLIFNLKRQAQQYGGEHDDEAEYDSPTT
ncbi:MAG: D-alanine--D-alanine ligase, partial [Myxococcales bacterium]|nr:D-alanine--D-alanine ligase [Myxococcales bacterium]